MPLVYSEKLKRKERKLFELLPGYTCNSNCLFCSIDPNKRKINSTTQELLKIIYQAKKDGFKYLGIGGGEPTIRKDLLTLIKFAKKLKFEVIRIETNGIALAYPDYCERLVEAGLDFVKISIHGHKAKIHDSLTRVPGAFNNVMRAIENLQKLKVRIEINTVINKVNYKFYPQFVGFFAKKGIGSFCFVYPLHIGEMAKNWKKIGIGIKEITPYLKETLDLVNDLELDKGIIFNIPPCCLPGYEKEMVEFSPFNTKVGSPDNVIESVDFDRTKTKIKFKRCQKCKYFKDCEGVWPDYLKFFGNKEFQPIYGKSRKEN